MKINLKDHYFNYYAGYSEMAELEGFHVGEIVMDWEGCVGCILLIFKNGEVRTDSNGMGMLSWLKKVRSRKKIERYLLDLHRADMKFMLSAHKRELATIP